MKIAQRLTSHMLRTIFFWTAILALLVTTSVCISLALTSSPNPLSVKFAKESWTEKESQKPVTIMLTGDIMLGRYIATLRDRNGGDFPFTTMPDVIKSIKTKLGVDKLDLIAGNLEGPITDKQVAWGDMVFCFKPEIADLLKNTGFTTFNLANNHIFNQTRDGLTQTHTRLVTVGIDSFGNPDTPNGDLSFQTYNFGKTSIGFLGLNDTDFQLDMDETTARIKELDSQVDFLIVAVHWGFEYEPTARESIVTKAHAFVDAGADFIWGTHPHVVQNHEEYNGAQIYYSLGNFVFDQYWSAATQEGLVLGLKIEDGKITVVEQMVDLVNGGEPTPRAVNL